MLCKRFIARASRGLNLFILAMVSLLVSLLTLKLRPLRMFPALIAIIMLFIATAVLCFIIVGLWIDLFYPVIIMAVVYIALTLYKYVGEWKRRIVIENELGIAKKIQESFLPKSLPEIDGLDIAATMFTARQVGGDLYDFLGFGAGRLGVMIGDVSGKGVPASLFMAMVIGKFKFLATTEIRPSNVLYNLNAVLVKESASNLFVTVFYTIFDMNRSVVSYSNGGHLPLIQAGPGRELTFLDVEEGAPLGLMEGPYTGRDAAFKKGDIFVFYTDGITEAMNARSDMYGVERLAAVIESHKDVSAKELLGFIEKDVRKFEPKASQHDDMTVIVIKII